LQQIKIKAEKPVKSCKVVADGEALSELMAGLHNNPKIACDMIREKNPPQELIGMAFRAGGDSFYLPLGHTPAKESLDLKETFTMLAFFFYQC